MEYLVVVPVAYLLGSMPVGLLLVRWMKGVDIREVGSGMTGMTNVLRAVGAPAAVFVLLVDMGKGVAAVAIAHLLSDSALAQATAGIMVVLGHNWSIFIRFRGGRGMAPAGGALLLMMPWAGLAAPATFLPVALVSRYASLGSLAAVAAGMSTGLATMALDIYSPGYALFVGVVGALLVVRHGGNIRRLLQGTERRLGERVQLPRGTKAGGEGA